MAKTFDIGASIHHFANDKSPQEIDITALRSDWDAVGRDIRNATKEYARSSAARV